MNKPQQNVVSEAVPREVQAFPGAVVLLKQAWKVWKTHLSLFFQVVLPAVLVSGGFLLVYLVVPSAGVLAVIGGILNFVVSLWVGVSLLYAVKERDESITAKEALKKGWGRIFSYLWVTALGTFIAVGGFLLLIIPGIILSVWFILSVFVLVDEDRRGMTALLRSKNLVSGHWGGVFWRFFFFGIVSLLVMIPLFILFALLTAGGALLSGDIETALLQLDSNDPTPLQVAVQVPYLAVQWLLSALGVAYGYLLYQNLKQLKAAVPFEEPTTKRKLKYLIIGAAGIIVIGGIIGGTVFMSLYGARDAARDVASDAHLQADMRQTQVALEVYYSEHNAYPASLTELSGEFIPEGLERFEYSLIEGGRNYQICAEFKEKERECKKGFTIQ